MLPFAALHRAVSASVSFILLLFMYWKFHVTDRQNRSLFFRGQIHAHFFSHFSASALYYFFPTQPQHRHIKVLQDLQYIIERNWPVKKNSWRPAYSEDTPVKRAGIGIIISASSTSLPYSITHTAKYILCDIRSLNIYVPSEVSTEPDLSFDRSSTFE